MTPVDDPYRVPYDRCPACGSGEFALLREEVWWTRPDFRPPLDPVIRWMKCAACAHEFTSGYHTAEAAAMLFERSQEAQTPEGLTASDVERWRNVWVRVVDAVTPRVAEGRWLDVGAGSGMLAAVARECGFDVAVIEARPAVASGLAERGFSVIGSALEDLVDCPDQFDVVTMCDVLEHMPFPLDALDLVSTLLTRGGVLFISCPNRDSLAWDSLNAEERNPYWAEIEHFHNFSFRQLRPILSARGFARIVCSVSNRYRVCMDVIASKAGSPL